MIVREIGNRIPLQTTLIYDYQVGKKTVDKVRDTTLGRNAWSTEQQLTDAYSKNVVGQVRERADDVYIKRDLWFCHGV